MIMSGELRLDQVFYGSGPKGYDILATSFAEVPCAWSAVNACLAIGLVPGSGLPKPILLSRILDDRIVMAKICNGAKDSSGRNTLFIHALVSTTQEARMACVSTFSLADSGAFCDKVSDSSDKPLFVDAASSVVSKSQESLELPAAIETSEPREEIIRRVVCGKENVLSWSTFAYGDMSGYDIICLSPLASSPDERNIYDADLRLVRKAIVNKSCLSPVPIRDEYPRPEQKCVTGPNSPGTGSARRKNGLLLSLIVSIVVNLVLLVMLIRVQPNEIRVQPNESGKEKQSEIVKDAIREFTDEKRVTDEQLKQCGYPVSDILSNSHPSKWKDSNAIFNKLLAYRAFVETKILNQIKEE